MSGTSAAHHLEPAQKVHSVQSAASVSVAGHEIGYPHGHLGSLSGAEEEALRNFKTFAEEKGLYTAGPPASHDDQTLLRYLRARRWVVPDAYKQFHDTEVWRKENHLDVLYETIDLEAYEQCRRLYPQWTGRRDRRGIPVYLFEIRHLDSKTVAEYEKTAEKAYSKAHADGSTPPKLLRLFALYENLTRFAQPMCTQLPDRDHPHVPITLSTNIVDVSGVSLRQFWNLKSHMQAASQLATAHYPETLDRIFIIGAPYFFSTVWGWIKRWFDPITVSKIFILSSAEVRPTLEAFIDPANVPSQYGGGLEFKFGDKPNLDPFIRDRATWENGHQSFPNGPLYWRVINDGKEVECVAVGSVGQEQRWERVCTLPKTFPKEEQAVVPAPAPAVAVENGTEVPKVEVTEAETEAEASTANGAAEEEAAAEASIQDGVQSLAISEDTKKDSVTEISEKILETEQDTKATAATVSA